LGKLKSIREYILELKREIYKQNIKRKDEPFLLVITVQDNLLYYLVKIKGSSENDFAIIHPKLYAKLTPHLNPNNKIHIYLLEDFLLNYSKFYSENTQVPVFLVLNENKSEQISKTDLKLDIPFEENTEAQFRELALYSIKLTLLNQIIEKAIANVRIGLKCENCDKEYTRMPVFTRCKKCRKKLRYKWNKGPLIPIIKEIEKQTQTFNLFPYIKKIRRPVIRFVEGYFKDYDAYEKLDKFL
jgi:Zn finger protein HypA/HybF involved in hydrogenase expression